MSEIKDHPLQKYKNEADKGCDFSINVGRKVFCGNLGNYLPTSIEGFTFFRFCKKSGAAEVKYDTEIWVKKIREPGAKFIKLPVAPQPTG